MSRSVSSARQRRDGCSSRISQGPCCLVAYKRLMRMRGMWFAPPAFDTRRPTLHACSWCQMSFHAVACDAFQPSTAHPWLISASNLPVHANSKASIRMIGQVCPMLPCALKASGKRDRTKHAMVLILRAGWSNCLQDNCQRDKHGLNSSNDQMPEEH